MLKGDVQNPGHRRNVVRGELDQAWQAEPDRESRARTVTKREWEARDPAVREFLRVQYGGRCQICDFGFPKRDGNPYFETVWLTEVGQGQWTDQPGNALCLCANCAAKFLHGSQSRDGWLETIRTWRTRKEGGKVDPALALGLCGQPCTIRYTEKHFMSLQELVAFEPAEQTARL